MNRNCVLTKRCRWLKAESLSSGMGILLVEVERDHLILILAHVEFPYKNIGFSLPQKFQKAKSIRK